MLTRQTLSEQIGDQLVFLKRKITIMNNQGLYDANIYAQDILCRLYNTVFGIQLNNLNKEKTTVEGIDLGDTENRIAVQVTSENNSTKIKETIRIFIEKQLYKDYDRLIFGMLSDKKKYRTQFDTNHLFCFDAQSDIIDFNDLALHIKDCSIEKQKEVFDILNEELGNKTTVDCYTEKNNIQAVEKQITARCRSRLISAGIADELATIIIDNDIECDRYSDILDAAMHGIIYLQGEFGSGKSHALLILALRMIREYSNDNTKPLPIYTTANEIVNAGGVQAWKEKQQKAESYFIFIDGCDEMSIVEADKVLNEILYLQSLWSNAQFLLCGRPLHLCSIEGKAYNIPPLSEDQIISLISLISGKDKTDVSRRIFFMEKDLKETLKRPLYSVLFAVLLKQAGDYFRTSYSELIAQFVDWTLNTGITTKAEIALTLERAAVLSVDRNIGNVHISEIGGEEVYKVLQQTGFLLLHQNNTVSFPLPIIAQWFAAEGLLHKRVSIEDILDDELRSSRWRNAFALMFSKMTFDESLDLFTSIIKKDTGLVADIIRNGTINEFMRSSPSPLECGVKILKCIEIWADALGDLKNVLLPYENNQLKKLAISVVEGRITTTWSNIQDANNVCVLSPIEQIRWRGKTQSCSLFAQSTWPWIFTFNYISTELKNNVQYRSLLCDNDDIMKEYVWKTTLSLLGKGSLYQEPIPLSSIEEYRKFRKYPLIIRRTEYHLDVFFSLVDLIYKNGIHSIEPAVPSGDKEFGKGRFIWSHYSEQRLYERVCAIYEKALQAYSDFMSDLFLSFVPRMRVAAIMPVIFHANLTYKEDGLDQSDGPALTWHMEAQPKTMKNKIEITLNETDAWQDDPDTIHSILEKDIFHRPLQREWLGPVFHSQLLRCFDATPITDVVFSWIEDDLKEIGWIS